MRCKTATATAVSSSNTGTIRNWYRRVKPADRREGRVGPKDWTEATTCMMKEGSREASLEPAIVENSRHETQMPDSHRRVDGG
jgi:hypothetical protein